MAHAAVVVWWRGDGPAVGLHGEVSWTPGRRSASRVRRELGVVERRQRLAPRVRKVEAEVSVVV